MDKIKLKAINDQVFSHLRGLHFSEKEAGKPPLFFMMNENNRQVAHWGEPFRTDNKRVSLSFWSNESQLNNKLYALSFDIYNSGLIQFVARRDPRIKPNVFNRLAEYLPNAQVNDEGIIKNYSIDHQGNIYVILSNLDAFLKDTKPQIDRWVQAYGAIDEDTKSELVASSTYYKTEKYYAAMIRPEHFDEMLRSVQIALAPKSEVPQSLSDAPDMPVRLTRLEVRNYKGIKDIAIAQIPASTRWIFLTGENSFGKTSVLQALAIGLWGPRDGERNLVGEFEKPWIEAELNQDGQPVHRFFSPDSSQPPSTTSPPLMMAAYGAGRLLASGSVPLEKANRRNGAVSSLFDSRTDLLNIEYELVTANLYNPPYFDLLIGIFKDLIPDLADIRINVSRGTPFVEYYEKDANGQLFPPVKLSELGSGFRSLLGFVGDMVLRLSAYQENFNKREDLKGIVIIDELELYLHVKYQRILPGKLSELFPNVQFIASTHSPIPLLGAPKETLILTLSRDEKAGVQVNATGVDISKLLPNAILTSPIFGFDDIIPASADGMADVETTDSYTEAQQNIELKEQFRLLKSDWIAN